MKFLNPLIKIYKALWINIEFMELGATISYSLGIVSGTVVVLFGIGGGIISGIIGGLIERLFSSESLKLNSDCLNYKYIPKKYREINKWKQKLCHK